MAVMADEITLLFSELLVFDSLLEAECKCREDATKLDVAVAGNTNVPLAVH